MSRKLLMNNVALNELTIINLHPEATVGESSSTVYHFQYKMPFKTLKPSTKYYIGIYDSTADSIITQVYFSYTLETKQYLNVVNGKKYSIFTTSSYTWGSSDSVNTEIHFYPNISTTLNVVKETKMVMIEYFEGLENKNIPYFTGTIKV